jgi:UDP-N-acetylmuramoyl-L-alanyl-D-glutamate--2,6-diaminopimelate ligase
MGEVSGRLADLTVITSDNPRFEEPMDIIADIETGIRPTGGAYVTVPDRKEAIRYAITHGQPGDIIVLAGKGHEDYEFSDGERHPFDEKSIVYEAFLTRTGDKEKHENLS